MSPSWESKAHARLCPLFYAALEGPEGPSRPLAAAFTVWLGMVIAWLGERALRPIHFFLEQQKATKVTRRSLHMARKNRKKPRSTSHSTGSNAMESKALADAEKTAPVLRPTVEYSLPSGASKEEGADMASPSLAFHPETDSKAQTPPAADPKGGLAGDSAGAGDRMDNPGREEIGRASHQKTVSLEHAALKNLAPNPGGDAENLGSGSASQPTFNGMPSLLEPIPAAMDSEIAKSDDEPALPELDDDAKTIVQEAPRKASGLPAPAATMYPRPQDPEIRSDAYVPEPVVPPAQAPLPDEQSGIPQAVHDDKSTMYVVSELVSSIGGEHAAPPMEDRPTPETRVEPLGPVTIGPSAAPKRHLPKINRSATKEFPSKTLRVAMMAGGALVLALVFYGMGRRHEANRARDRMAPGAIVLKDHEVAVTGNKGNPSPAKRIDKSVKTPEDAHAQADSAQRVKAAAERRNAGPQEPEEYPELLDEDSPPEAQPSALDPGSSPGQAGGQLGGELPSKLNEGLNTDPNPSDVEGSDSGQSQVPSTPVTPSKHLPAKRPGSKSKSNKGAAGKKRPQSPNTQVFSPQQLLAQARRAKGQKAYRLAAASYSKQKSWAALERMATAACEMNNLTLAREALRRLSVGQRRRKVRQYCRSIGIRLGVVL